MTQEGGGHITNFTIQSTCKKWILEGGISKCILIMQLTCSIVGQQNILNMLYDPQNPQDVDIWGIGGFLSEYQISINELDSLNP